MRISGSEFWRRGSATTAALAGACITCAAAVAIAVGFSLTPVDDAFISLRYAANWAAGNGLCFNPGEHVEGYTNFLLVLIETAAIRLGADPVVALRVIGWASLFGLALVLTRFIALHLFPGRACLSTAAGVLASVNPVFICWTASGMESCLYALLLFLSVMTLLGAGKGIGIALSAVCLILAAMTRPEAAGLLPVMAAVVYLKHRSIRCVAWFVCIFVLGFGLYFMLRALHFGQLFPNTFYAKVDYGGVLLLWRGATYVWQFITATLPLFALALFSIALIRSAPLWVKAFALVAAGQLAIVIYEGGDHFAMFRFMVPVVPFLSGLALYPCAHLPARHRISDRARLRVALLGLAALGVSDVTACTSYKKGEVSSQTQFDHFTGECSLARDWALVGGHLRDHAPPDATVCTMAIGAIGYYSGLTIIDPHGIIDPVIAHQQRELGRGYPGHEKYDCQYTLSRRPSYILIFYMFTPKPLREDVLEEMVWGEFNRELLRQPLLWQEYELRAFRAAREGSQCFNLFVRRELAVGGGASTAE